MDTTTMDTTTNEATYVLTRALDLVTRRHAAEMKKADMAKNRGDLETWASTSSRAEGLAIAMREIRTIRDGNAFVEGLI